MARWLVVSDLLQPVSRLRWGVLLPTFDVFGQGPLPVVEAARRAEALGFDAVWAGDHLVAHVPVLDSLCSLAAAAAVTSEVEVGVSVLQIALRPLVWTAKQLATLDALAPGRVRLGVGLGGEYEEELVAAGVSRRHRGSTVDEMLGVLPALLRGEAVDHPGPHAPVRVGGLQPAPAKLPKVSVGGRREPALQRAARFADQWLPMWLDAKAVRVSGERLASLSAELGRPAPSLGLLVLTNVDADAARARDAADTHVRRQYRIDLDPVERWTAYGPAERVAEMLSDYRDAGVSEVILMPTGDDPLCQYERWVEVRELLDGPGR